MRIGLEQIDYEAVNLTGRMCINGDFAPHIELLRLDKLSESNAKPSEGRFLAAVEPNTDGDGLPGCPLRCNRRMISIHSSLQTNLVQQLEPKSLIPYFEMLQLKHLDDPKDRFVNEGDPPIEPKDLIFLDIHPVSEMVNQVI
ncbi:hypothetical protein AHF37_04903 [Paragonimus kellicotti]|nr:hypothetical protein AHF37_04903 [Paragonimus kellicotti]